MSETYDANDNERAQCGLDGRGGCAGRPALNPANATTSGAWEYEYRKYKHPFFRNPPPLNNRPPHYSP